MTYICSLAPLNCARLPVSNLLETQINFSWQSSSVILQESRIRDEWTITYKYDNTSFSCSTHNLKFQEWIPLLGNQIVTIKPVFLGSLKAENLYCIRLYAIEHTVPIDYSSVKLLQHESILYKVLNQCLVFCEPLEKMTKKWRSQHAMTELKPTMAPLSNGYGLNLNTYAIDKYDSGTLGKQKYFHPIIIAHEVANRHNLALQLAVQEVPKNYKVLIITETAEVWKEKCFQQSILAKCIGSHGIHKDVLDTFNIYILSEEELIAQQFEYRNLIESFESMMGTVMGQKPTENQIKRYMKHRFIDQFNVHLPVFLVDWTTVIYDDSSITAWRDLLNSKYIVQTIIRNEILTEWPSFRVIAASYGISPKEAQVMMSTWSRSIHFVEMPRYILRKIKIRCEHVRSTVGESRLQTLESKFTESFIKRYRNHLLHRLSPIVYSPALFVQLLENMNNLPSIHDILERKNIIANLEHCIQEYNVPNRSCGVCFDPCSSSSNSPHQGPHQHQASNQRTLTICGHTFCSECSIQLFADAIRDITKFTSCPYCRTPLHAGDIFTISDDHGLKEFLKPAKLQLLQKLTKVSCVIDTLGQIKEATGTTETCPAGLEKIHIVIVSLQKDQLNEISNWLIQLASRPRSSVKVTLLAGASDTWAEKLMSLLK